MKVLFVHGVGHTESAQDWGESWNTTMLSGLHHWSPDVEIQPFYSAYDDLFRGSSLPSVPAALIRGLLSGLEHGVIDRIVDFFRGRRGIGEVPDWLHWHVGMVAMWLGDSDLRSRTRDQLVRQTEEVSPDVVVAHSLGSLISYDALTSNPSLISKRTYITLGSQIGNPFVVDQWAAGRVVDLEEAIHWYHLYNPKDPVLTAPLRISDGNFSQIQLETKESGIEAHDALVYLRSPEVGQTAWLDLAGRADTRGLTRSKNAIDPRVRVRQQVAAVITDHQKAKRRALLIGINTYPDPANQLDGCVNDVFLMSSVLQERGFDPEDIRVVLNDRATAAGIRGRLEWLLGGVKDGDERFLFYSGHGAQMPIYGSGKRIERVDECLVPYDFQWTPETAITDESFRDLYTQLPYDARFIAVFDCCHSGGMTRGSAPKVRGLDIPDDIRHRMIRWDAKKEMWIDRDLPTSNKSLAAHPQGQDYLGSNKATSRLGRAMALRTLPNTDYDNTRKRLGHKGPYMPILLEACQQDEKAYEYRHGVTSFGAFSYSLATILRRQERAKAISFSDLMKAVSAQLKELGYHQQPALVGPEPELNAHIPGRPSRSDSKA